MDGTGVVGDVGKVLSLLLRLGNGVVVATAGIAASVAGVASVLWRLLLVSGQGELPNLPPPALESRRYGQKALLDLNASCIHRRTHSPLHFAFSGQSPTLPVQPRPVPVPTHSLLHFGCMLHFPHQLCKTRSGHKVCSTAEKPKSPRRIALPAKVDETIMCTVF